MKYSLVGYSGFVGGNLAATHTFDNLYNSKNIQDSYGADNGYVVYSGMPAEKFLANADPNADLQRAETAMDNIRKMRPERLVLISTVDVYPKPMGVYEDTVIDNANAPAYGKNRYTLEGWVREEYPDALIVRLPGLYGRGLKKNFIYDLLTITPSMLVEGKYKELSEKSKLVKESYSVDDAGFYRLQNLDTQKAEELKSFYEQNDFNALSFTDSRSVFQFYNLASLWKDIARCEKKGIRLVNLATQPVEAGALYRVLTGCEWENHTAKGPVQYDMRTRYGRELGGLDGYVADHAEVMSGIANMVKQNPV